MPHEKRDRIERLDELRRFLQQSVISILGIQHPFPARSWLLLTVQHPAVEGKKVVQFGASLFRATPK